MDSPSGLLPIPFRENHLIIKEEISECYSCHTLVHPSIDPYSCSSISLSTQRTKGLRDPLTRAWRPKRDSGQGSARSITGVRDTARTG